MGSALRTLGVPTDAPVNNVILPPEGSRDPGGDVMATLAAGSRSEAARRPRRRRALAKLGVQPRRITSDSRRSSRASRSPRIRVTPPTAASSCPTRSRAGRARCCGSSRGFQWDAQLERAASRRSRDCSSGRVTSPTSSTAARRATCGWSASPAPTARRRARNGSRRRSMPAGAAPRSLGTLGNGLTGALAPAAHTTPDVTVLHELLAQFHAARGARGRDGGVLARTRPGPRQRRELRRRAVHQPDARPSRLSRTMGAYGAAKAKLFAWPGAAHAP